MPREWLWAGDAFYYHERAKYMREDTPTCHCSLHITCRLHYAAPTLLEALEQAEAIVGKVVADSLMPDIAAPGYPNIVYRNIRAAIAQAKGETV